MQCVSLVPGQGTKIPHAAWPGKKKKSKKKNLCFALFVYILGSLRRRKGIHILNDSVS